ncbi:ATP-binding protein [Promicromonospora kroppenstedtii]|uniref:histidine kinase n=1 Tax=Promicromonospora kroppenstedtii TaxID=440482 RepID=A0ABW7XL61_9MICO
MLKERLAGIPLRARLVAIISLLLAAGLGIAAVATTTVVSTFLVQQVDDELDSASRNLSSTIDSLQPGSTQALPSDYYVKIVGEQSEPEEHGVSAILRFGRPELPDVTYEEAAASKGEEFTTSGKSNGAGTKNWRVVTVAAQYTTGEPAVVYVALPLVGMDNTVSILTRTLIMSGLGIVLLGGLTAWVLVERSLRSLRSVEHTAAQIAAGDLSQRVPEAPAGTEMGSLSTSLNAMLTQIERAFAAQEASEVRMRQFVSDASHELRTPVATIRGYGELYRMGALDTADKVDDTMVRIEDAARRMGTLVNDLLVLARLDEGRPVAREDVDLAALARDSAQDLHALDPTREVTVVPLLKGGSVPEKLIVEGDTDRLRQVLTNLIGNVARHTPAGTPAEIALGVRPGTAGANGSAKTGENGERPPGSDKPSPGGVAVLEVRDHGQGLTEEQGRRIFERFYRADSSRTRESGGSGLGMAIVAAIVGTHGGHVEVAQTPGGGLTVRLTLPL